MHAPVERRQRKGNWTFQKEQRQAEKKRPTCLHSMRKQVAGRKGSAASGLGGVDAPLGI